MPRNSQAYHITWNKLSGKDLLLLAVTNTKGPHCDIPFKTSHDIGSLLFLIPAHGGIKTQDTNNDTKVNPVI